MRLRGYKSLLRLRYILVSSVVVAMGILVASSFWIKPFGTEKPVIITNDIPNTTRSARIIQGTNNQPKGKLSTDSKVTLESLPIDTKSKTANALVVEWEELPQPESSDGNDGSVGLQVRTAHRNEWTDWVNVPPSDDDRKDGTQQLHKAIVLADVVEKLQYRIIVEAGSETAPVLDVDKTKVQVIDTSRGPKMKPEQSVIQKALSFMTNNKVSAKADAPRIYQREEWGGEENPSIGWYPNSSPAWPEEYARPNQIIVHHTATTSGGDSFAAMRAIWQFHANNNGWGDIGYNYIVDPWGNIFKGRHYVEADAKQQGGEVIGGHTYGHNTGTIGISIMGDYTSTAPTADALYSVARIAAYKAMPYRFNPAEQSNLIGHRDATSTSCPGQQVYNRLPEIRNLANTYYSYYVNMDSLDALYVKQGSYGVMWPNTNAPAYIDIKNNGSETWSNSGSGAIVLATDRPKGRTSQFADTSWVASDKVGSFSQKVQTDSSGKETVSSANTIAPGEVARFSFTIRAPGAGGFYREYFNILANNRTWFIRDLGIYFELTVPPPTYEWKVTEQDVYSDATKSTRVDQNNLRPNTRYFVRLRGYNAGNQTWYRDGQYPTRLATASPNDRKSAFCDSTWIYIDCNRPTALQESSVDPMQQGTFEFWIKTPSQLGQYRERFNLTVERKGPMKDAGMYLDLGIASGV